MTTKNLTIHPELMDYFVLDIPKCKEHFGRILEPMEIFILYHRRCKKTFNRDLVKHLLFKQWNITKKKMHLLTDEIIDSFAQSILDRLDLENQKLNPEFKLAFCIEKKRKDEINLDHDFWFA